MLIGPCPLWPRVTGPEKVGLSFVAKALTRAAGTVM